MYIIGSSDLHIRNHSKHNIYPEFRLGQWITLGKMMSMEAVRHNSKTYIIAGDIFDTPKPSPIEHFYFRGFINILLKVTDSEIWCIHGQHDFAAKSLEGLDSKNTYLSSISDPRFHYIHNERVNLDGKTFYFKGWEPNFTPPPKCDVFVGHGFVDGAKVGNWNIQGQGFSGIDCELGILGDIHHRQRLGNIYIPGTPFQNSFSDPEDTSFFTLNTEDLEIKEIFTKGKFLRFTRIDPGKEDPMVVYQPKLEAKKFTDSLDLNKLANLDIQGILNTLLNDFEHKDELVKCFGGDYSDDSNIALEFKVKLKRIVIENFGSIDKLDISFDTPHNLHVLHGPNGSGKSTLLRAFIWVLTNNIKGFDSDDVIKSGKKHCKVFLELEYDQRIITIDRKRGSGASFEITESGKIIDANNKRDLQKRLEEILPIINKLHLLYFQQSRDGLLAELSDSSRVSLISELSGQTVVNRLTDQAEKHIGGILEACNVSQRKVSEINFKIEGFSENLVKVDDPSFSIDLTQDDLKVNAESIQRFDKEIEELATKCKDEIDIACREINLKITTKRDEVKKLNNFKSQINDKLGHLYKISEQVESWTCDKCSTVISNKDYSIEDRNTAQSNIILFNSKLDKIHKLIDKHNADARYMENIEKSHIEDMSHQGYNEKVSGLLSSKHQLEKDRHDLTLKLGGLNTELKVYNKYLEASLELKKYEVSKKELEKIGNELEEKRVAFTKIFKEVFGGDGLLSAAILEKISNLLNEDDNIQIITTKTLKNGKVKPTLDMNMKVGEHFQPYNRLSGGQKLYADLYLLEKFISMVGGVGILLMDEILKYADAENAAKMFALLEKSKVMNILLVFHGDIPDNIECQKIAVEIVNGTSKYTTDEK